MLAAHAAGCSSSPWLTSAVALDDTYDGDLSCCMHHCVSTQAVPCEPLSNMTRLCITAYNMLFGSLLVHFKLNMNDVILRSKNAQITP